MLRTIFWYMGFPISLLFKIPDMIKMKKLKETMSEMEFFQTVNKIAFNWAKIHLKNAGADIEIKGSENIPEDRNVLFVSNHQSNFDVAIFIGEIEKDKTYISKVEMLKIPLVRTWMRYLNCIFIDRNNLKSQGKAVIDGIKLLKNGYSLVVFPEGTRSKKSELGEFKQATLKLATKSGVPIIPVTIDGSYKLMEANNNKIKPAKVYVTIHPIIETNDIKNDELEILNEKIVNTIKNGLVYSI